jgi:hypothetical protein
MNGRSERPFLRSMLGNSFREGKTGAQVSCVYGVGKPNDRAQARSGPKSFAGNDGA